MISDRQSDANNTLLGGNSLPEAHPKSVLFINTPVTK